MALVIVLVNYNNPIKPIQSQCFQKCIFFSSKCILSLFRTRKSSADRCIPIVSAEMQTEKLNNSHHMLHQKKGWFAVTDWYTRPDQRLNWIQTLMMVEGTLGKVACVSSSILSNLQTNKYRRNTMMQTITSTTESKAWS